MATASDDRNTTRSPVQREVHGTNIDRDIDRPEDEHPDAITGAPGSHPVGTGVGAATAGAAGAVVGSVIPGVGTAIGGAVGAIVGAVAGGLAGKAVSESINPTDEHAFWREEYRNRDYYKAHYNYDADYGPAYSNAIDAYNSDPARPFEAAEPELQESWENRRGQSRLDWDGARSAMRDVYSRTRGKTAGSTLDKV